MKPLLAITLLGMLAFGQACRKSLGTIVVKEGGPAGADLECDIVGWSADKQSVYINLPCRIKGTLETALPNNTVTPVLAVESDEEPKLECTTDGKTANAPCSAEEPAKTKH